MQSCAPARRDRLSQGTNHLRAKSISDKLYESDITQTRKSKPLDTLEALERDNQEYDRERHDIFLNLSHGGVGHIFLPNFQA